MTKNAYIVLSVTDIRELLKRAIVDQKAQKNPSPSHCVVLEGIGINEVVGDGELQISSASFIIAARKALPLPPVGLPKAPVNALYSFTFHGGGFNQVWATNKRQAIERARAEFPGMKFQPDTRSFKRLATAKAQDTYWKSFPLLD
jgi:hypothetical protein